MNIGEDKGKIVTDVIEKFKPKVLLECGGYCGFSAIKFADAMRQASGDSKLKYWCLEMNPKFAKVGFLQISFSLLRG